MDKEAVLHHLGSAVKADYPLAKLTSFKVGGPADFFAAVRAEGDLVELVRRAWAIELPVFIMGNGSNILLADRGIRGLVIHNQCSAVSYELREEATGNRQQATAEGRWQSAEGKTDRATRNGASALGTRHPALHVSAQSGAMLPRVAHEAIKRGFHDLVYATGIPGTVGGAVMSNAGAYGWCMARNLASVRYLASDGEVRSDPNERLELSYRHSRFKRTGEIVLAAELLLHQSEPPAKSGELNRKRRESQPLTMPNAGSMFKNPPNAAAGYLIEQAGLKGRRCGNAQISDKHANFIVNLGGAQAAEVLELIRIAQAAVKEPLELEVQLVGEWV